MNGFPKCVKSINPFLPRKKGPIGLKEKKNFHKNIIIAAVCFYPGVFFPVMCRALYRCVFEHNLFTHSGKILK